MSRRGSEHGHTGHRRDGHEHGHGHAGQHRGEHGHGHAGQHRGEHGNPEDLDAYLARLEDPERAVWQKPEDVVAALGLRPGAIACDVGVGPGYFAIPMARAVGPAGRVYAVDVEARMLEVLARRLRDAGIDNVRPILAPGGDAGLPPEACDAILTVNTFHHFPDRAGALRLLASRLRPGGTLAVVDFHAGELPVGPPADHKVAREDFLAAVRQAGLEVAAERTFLPYQWYFALAAAPPAATR